MDIHFIMLVYLIGNWNLSLSEKDFTSMGNDCPEDEGGIVEMNDR